jgi:cytochrome c-type biogenesis protein CcmH
VNPLWLSIALITIFVVMIMALPLLRNRSGSETDTQRADYDVALYKDQLKEIDRDLERGILTDDQADAARTEIQRKLLSTADGLKKRKSTSGTASSSGRGIITAGVISVFVSVGAFATYNHLGSPNLRNLAYADRNIEAEENAQQDNQVEQEMQVLLNKLAERLQKNPDDLEGWLMLGRSLMARRRYNESAAAYKHALDLNPDDPGIAVDYAEAVIFTNQGQVSKPALEVLQKAYTRSRDNPKIRYYIGLQKAQNNDVSGAVQEWINIAALSPADAPWMPTVRQQINAALKESGLDRSSFEPSAEALEIAKTKGIGAGPRIGTSPAAPGPTAEDVQAAQQMSSEDQSKMIRGMVERLANRMKTTPDDIEGWKRLANAYQVLGEDQLAKEALARVTALQNK